MDFWLKSLWLKRRTKKPLPSGAMGVFGRERQDAKLVEVHSAPRASLQQPEPISFAVSPECLQVGVLEQVGTLDQFSESFEPLLASHNAPRSACGYFSVANALVLAAHLPASGTVSRPELGKILEVLKEQDAILPELTKILEFVESARKSYVEAGAFGKEEAESYMKDWVANYEISDYLIHRAAEGHVPGSVHFLRYNQMPEISTAKHEELQRLQEEKLFGGCAAGQEDKGKSECVLEEGATRFILERFVPQRALQRPEDWARQEREAAASEPKVLIVDIDGHFLVATGLEVQEAEGTKPVLLVVNTTKSSYLDWPALSYAFDLLFGVRCT